MPKLVIGGIIALGAVAVIGGIIYFATTQNKTAPTGKSDTSSQQAGNETKLVDPNGDYKLFSDPSVTKFPEKNAKFGNGQVLTFEYDGSKTANDPYATLSYQLYYIDENGSVQPMGGGNVEGKDGKGVFKTAEGDKVFNSLAKNRSGFFELQGTYDSHMDDNHKITAKNVKLGMYAIKFDISD